MAKKDRTSIKDTLVLEPEEIEVIESDAVANDDDDRVDEERKKLENMTKSELEDYLLQTKENLWSSHEQRERLEGEISERDASIKDLSLRLSDSLKRVKELEAELDEEKNEKILLKNELGKSKQKADRVEELEQSLEDTKDASKNTEQNLKRAYEADLKGLKEAHKAETDDFKEAIVQLKSENKELKTDNKKLKADLKKSNERVDALEEDYGAARDANFAGMIVRDIPREMGIGFEEADEWVKEQFDALMDAVRGRYLSVACGVIESADTKISNQENAADALKKAKKELEDSESLSKLAEQRREAAEKKVAEAEKNFIEAKDEA